MTCSGNRSDDFFFQRRATLSTITGARYYNNVEFIFAKKDLVAAVRQPEGER